MMRIEFIGMKTKIITPSDQDVIKVIKEALIANDFSLKSNDIIIIASKIIFCIDLIIKKSFSLNIS